MHKLLCLSVMSMITSGMPSDHSLPHDGALWCDAFAGLPSDHALPDDPECLKFIQAYAADQQLNVCTAHTTLHSLSACALVCSHVQSQHLLKGMQ
jgi:hypothetical protein